MDGKEGSKYNTEDRTDKMRRHRAQERGKDGYGDPRIELSHGRAGLRLQEAADRRPREPGCREKIR